MKRRMPLSKSAWPVHRTSLTTAAESTMAAFMVPRGKDTKSAELYVKLDQVTPA
jgi:hypothetical protein